MSSADRCGYAPLKNTILKLYTTVCYYVQIVFLLLSAKSEGGMKK